MKMSYKDVHWGAIQVGKINFYQPKPHLTPSILSCRKDLSFLNLSSQKTFFTNGDTEMELAWVIPVSWWNEHSQSIQVLLFNSVSLTASLTYSWCCWFYRKNVLEKELDGLGRCNKNDHMWSSRVSNKFQGEICSLGNLFKPWNICASLTFTRQSVIKIRYLFRVIDLHLEM